MLAATSSWSRRGLGKALGASYANAKLSRVRTRIRIQSHNSREASFAPSDIARNLAQVIDGTTRENPAKVANPQSVPAITFSRPTTFARLRIRIATTPGCSIKLVV